MKHLALDSTQINSWLSCPRQYRLGYIEGLIPVVEEKAFSTGKLIHRMMECYYMLRQRGDSGTVAGYKTLQIVKAWLQGVPPHDKLPVEYPIFLKRWDGEEFSKPTDEEWMFLSQRFVSYYTEFGSEKFKIVAVEEGFSQVFHEIEDEYFVLEGRIDLLLHDGDDLIWVDHKSQERKMDHYPYSVQFLNYAIATGARVGMINYFGLQKSLSKGENSFFRRQPMRFSPTVLDDWKEELVRIYRDVLVARESENFRKNRHSCKNGLNRICQFTRICEQTQPCFESEIKRTMFKVREPWSPWRKEEENA